MANFLGKASWIRWKTCEFPTPQATSRSCRDWPRIWPQTSSTLNRLRVILKSDTYGRSSAPLENIGDTRYHARYYPRRLIEVLPDAITSVTQVNPKYANITLSDGSTAKTDFYKDGTRALQLFDSAVTSYFLKPLAATSARSPVNASAPTNPAWCRCCTSPTAKRSTTICATPRPSPRYGTRQCRPH